MPRVIQPGSPATAYSVIEPEVEIFAILPGSSSATQRFPSGPAVIPKGGPHPGAAAQPEKGYVVTRP